MLCEALPSASASSSTGLELLRAPRTLGLFAAVVLGGLRRAGFGSAARVGDDGDVGCTSCVAAIGSALGALVDSDAAAAAADDDGAFVVVFAFFRRVVDCACLLPPLLPLPPLLRRRRWVPAVARADRRTGVRGSPTVGVRSCSSRTLVLGPAVSVLLVAGLHVWLLASSMTFLAEC